jgi:hypothetical protein
MTDFFPVAWLKIMYSPGETVTIFAILDVATSKVSGCRLPYVLPIFPHFENVQGFKHQGGDLFSAAEF